MHIIQDPKQQKSVEKKSVALGSQRNEDPAF